ncbi:MAG: hypothetical protein JWL82_608 [Parcubacteria group bacterium]|nr:hypothetical protein [Parcubacteria group bacterium]
MREGCRKKITEREQDDDERKEAAGTHAVLEITETHAIAVRQNAAQHRKAIDGRKRDKVEEPEEEVYEGNGRGRLRELEHAASECEAGKERERYRKSEVREHARGSDYGFAPSLIPEIVRVIGYGLRPAEHDVGVRKHEEGRHDDGAHRVDVAERIKGEAASELCGWVAQSICGIAVGHFVDDYGYEKDQEGENGRGDIG